jgi:hypothetical protein
MALRDPLVLINGRPSLLPAGDQIPGSAVSVGGGGGSQEVYVQQTRPVASGPWVWWETDASGAIVDCTVNDGVP